MDRYDEDDDDRRGSHAHLRQGAYQEDEDHEDMYEQIRRNEEYEHYLETEEEGRQLREMREMMRTAGFPNDSDDELQRDNRESQQQHHHNQLRRQESLEGRQRNSRPVMKTYSGIEVNLTRLAKKLKLPLDNMLEKLAAQKLAKVPQLKKEMLALREKSDEECAILSEDANAGEEVKSGGQLMLEKAQDRCKIALKKTLEKALELKQALKWFDYNIANDGSRIFDGHNAQYVGGENGWKHISWEVKQELMFIDDPTYKKIRPLGGWKGGKKKTRRRKSRRRKSRRRKSRRRKSRRRKSRKKRKTRKKTRSK